MSWKIILNSEFLRIWNEVFVACFDVFSGIRLEIMVKITTNLRLDKRYYGADLNPLPPASAAGPNHHATRLGKVVRTSNTKLK
jgi:hypothetical protein